MDATRVHNRMPVIREANIVLKGTANLSPMYSEMRIVTAEINKVQKQLHALSQTKGKLEIDLKGILAARKELEALIHIQKSLFRAGRTDPAGLALYDLRRGALQAQQAFVELNSKATQMGKTTKALSGDMIEFKRHTATLGDVFRAVAATVGGPLRTALTAAKNELGLLAKAGAKVVINLVFKGLQIFHELIWGLAKLIGKTIVVYTVVRGLQSVESLAHAIGRVISKTVRVTVVAAGEAALKRIAAWMKEIVSKTVHVTVKSTVSEDKGQVGGITGGVMGSMLGYTVTFGTLGAISQAARGGVDLYKTIEQTGIALTQMFGSKAQSDEMLKWLWQIAKFSPMLYADLANYTKILSAWGYTKKEIQTWIPLLTDIGSAMGWDASQWQQTIYALGQVRTKGRLYAMEVRQLAEHGLPVYKALAPSYGYTAAKYGTEDKATTAFRQMIQEKGTEFEIPASIFEPAMQKYLAENYGGLTEKVAATAQGRWLTLLDVVSDFMMELEKPILKWVGDVFFPAAIKFAEEMKGSVSAIHARFLPLYRLIEGFYNWFMTLPKNIRNAVAGVAALLAVVIPMAPLLIAVRFWAHATVSILTAFGPTGIILAGVAATFKLLYDRSASLRGVIGELTTYLNTTFKNGVNVTIKLLDHFLTILAGIEKTVAKIDFKRAFTLGDITTVITALEKIGTGLKHILEDIIWNLGNFAGMMAKALTDSFGKVNWTKVGEDVGKEINKFFGIEAPLNVPGTPATKGKAATGIQGYPALGGAVTTIGTGFANAIWTTLTTLDYGMIGERIRIWLKWAWDNSIGKVDWGAEIEKFRQGLVDMWNNTAPDIGAALKRGWDWFTAQVGGFASWADQGFAAAATGVNIWNWGGNVKAEDKSKVKKDYYQQGVDWGGMGRERALEVNKWFWDRSADQNVPPQWKRNVGADNEPGIIKFGRSIVDVLTGAAQSFFVFLLVLDWGLIADVFKTALITKWNEWWGLLTGEEGVINQFTTWLEIGWDAFTDWLLDDVGLVNAIVGALQGAWTTFVDWITGKTPATGASGVAQKGVQGAGIMGILGAITGTILGAIFGGIATAGVGSPGAAVLGGEAGLVLGAGIGGASGAMGFDIKNLLGAGAVTGVAGGLFGAAFLAPLFTTVGASVGLAGGPIGAIAGAIMGAALGVIVAFIVNMIQKATGGTGGINIGELITSALMGIAVEEAIFVVLMATLGTTFGPIGTIAGMIIGAAIALAIDLILQILVAKTGSYAGAGELIANTLNGVWKAINTALTDILATFTSYLSGEGDKGTAKKPGKGGIGDALVGFFGHLDYGLLADTALKIVQVVIAGMGYAIKKLAEMLWYYDWNNACDQLKRIFEEAIINPLLKAISNTIKSAGHAIADKLGLPHQDVAVTNQEEALNTRSVFDVFINSVEPHSGGYIDKYHEGGTAGGVVLNSPPAGLSNDEVLAVLQTGERVLSRQQATTFESLATQDEQIIGSLSSWMARAWLDVPFGEYLASSITHSSFPEAVVHIFEEGGNVLTNAAKAASRILASTKITTTTTTKGGTTTTTTSGTTGSVGTGEFGKTAGGTKYVSQGITSGCGPNGCPVAKSTKPASQVIKEQGYVYSNGVWLPPNMVTTTPAGSDKIGTQAKDMESIAKTIGGTGGPSEASMAAHVLMDTEPYTVPANFDLPWNTKEGRHMTPAEYEASLNPQFTLTPANTPQRNYGYKPWYSPIESWIGDVLTDPWKIKSDASNAVWHADGTCTGPGCPVGSTKSVSPTPRPPRTNVWHGGGGIDIGKWYDDTIGTPLHNLKDNINAFLKTGDLKTVGEIEEQNRRQKEIGKLQDVYTKELNKLQDELKSGKYTTEQNVAITKQIAVMQDELNRAQQKVNDGMNLQQAQTEAQAEALSKAGGSWVNNVYYPPGTPASEIQWSSGVDQYSGQSYTAQQQQEAWEWMNSGNYNFSPYHSGGIAGLPRFHKGIGLPSLTGFGTQLHNDEILSILEKGERIFSKEDTARLDDIIATFASNAPGEEKVAAAIANWTPPIDLPQIAIHIQGNVDEPVLNKLKKQMAEERDRIIKAAMDEYDRRWNRTMKKAGHPDHI